MVIAGILFPIGFLIGLNRGYPAIVLASALVTLVVFPAWLIRGELGLFTILVWAGYLFALQAGFLLGGYCGLPAPDADLPEPDRAPRQETKPRPPQDGQAGPEQDSGK
ncbi:hypothetical protein [Bosea sp. (in: a-proteobacteria)]|uniref:hypothetical protein n=1 Tax=Bosea sp. (in: a-proteobacteria) TaxID=1871050 RepID=UPI00260EAC65|nr:hypothetical protein [Bosea sp. (in: a-proteobacteria)]MCO5093081.1 hypothetical protein [Bosea sp. (in: a-proteobacteria)]